MPTAANTAPKPKPVSESTLQRQCIRWLAFHENQGLLRYASCPNEGARDARFGARMKAQGLRAGFPDLQIFLPSYEHRSIRAPANSPRVLFCELKSEKGKLSEPQKVWRDFFTDGGFYWHEIRSLDELIAAVKPHLQRRAA